MKIRPARLPEWLLVALEEIGEPSHCIVKVCIDQYGTYHPAKKELHE
ncbi:MAG: hypothetical protein ACI8PB_000851 [Desulforhopalus sp.]